MDGSVSNVQFTERKRGFDPDEVANYLRHIDEKVAELRALASEAVERAELAEERARQAEASSGGREVDEVAEAAGVLSLAQRTADATVAEARAKADALITAATEDADRTRLAAEAQAQQLVAETRNEMESSRAEHLGAVRTEIDELAATRDAVAADVATLSARLEVERSRLREAAAVIARMADDPQSLGPVPASALSVSAVVPSAGARAASQVQPSGQGGAQVAPVEAAAQPEAAEPEVAEPEAPEPEAVEPEVPGPEPVAAAPLATSGADEVDAEPHGGDEGEPTGLFEDPIEVETSPLGPVDDQADEALRAFFEEDPDEDGESSRWGFRRR
jgi:ABC-2 type transport system ATP-binding protein